LDAGPVSGVIEKGDKLLFQKGKGKLNG